MKPGLLLLLLLVSYLRTLNERTEVLKILRESNASITILFCPLTPWRSDLPGKQKNLVAPISKKQPDFMESKRPMEYAQEGIWQLYYFLIVVLIWCYITKYNLLTLN
jgi:hypothetical protein